jgi:hypothetical protein
VNDRNGRGARLNYGYYMPSVTLSYFGTSASVVLSVCLSMLGALSSPALLHP